MRTALHFARNLVLTYMAAMAFAVPAFSHDAPQGGWVGHDTAAAERPAAWPTWGSHGGQQGCQPMRDGVLSEAVLVVTQSGDTERMGFDKAAARANDSEPANDVYVIGACQ